MGLYRENCLARGHAAWGNARLSAETAGNEAPAQCSLAAPCQMGDEVGERYARTVYIPFKCIRMMFFYLEQHLIGIHKVFQGIVAGASNPSRTARNGTGASKFIVSLLALCYASLQLLRYFAPWTCCIKGICSWAMSCDSMVLGIHYWQVVVKASLRMRLRYALH